MLNSNGEKPMTDAHAYQSASRRRCPEDLWKCTLDHSEMILAVDPKKAEAVLKEN